MASTIITKNSSTSTAVPAVGDLQQGELAVNVTDKKVYTKDSSAAIVKLVGSLGNQEASAVAITGGSIAGITDLAVADGGTGASTATNARSNLGAAASGANSDITSLSGLTTALSVAQGGTGVTSSTGSGSVVLSNSPTLVTPALGTPSAAVLTNATGLPLSTGISGLGTGVATFLGTPSSANLLAAVTDETGTGALVFANSPTLVTPALGTPASATLTNATGLPIGTGVSGLGTGVATALAVNVGSAGAPVVNGGVLGTPSSGTLTNATGLPISTGVSGLGTGVATALAVNVGSAGAPVLFNGALGTPSSGTVTNLTGTASININGTVGATTPTTGAFTTVAASSDVTLSGGTANGVTYLNGSKVLTSGSALSFNGTNALTVTANSAELYLAGGSSAAQGGFLSISRGGTAKILLGTASNVLGGGSNTSDDLTLFATAESRFYASSAEGMRLTSTGLGIGTSSPSDKLTVASNSCIDNLGANYKTFSGTNYYYGQLLLKDPSNRTVVVRSPGAVNEAEIGTSTGHPLNIITNDTVRATFDVSGNLGLGVTPSAWGGSFKAFQIASGGTSLWSDGSVAFYNRNTYYDGTNRKYVIDGYAQEYAQLNDGSHAWKITSSGSANGNISFTQAMTLDASGALLLGTTSATPANANGVIAFGGSDAGIIYLERQTGTDQLRFYTGGNRLGYVNTASSTLTIGTANYPLAFSTNDTERARIDSSGNLLVGTTTQRGRFTVEQDGAVNDCGGMNNTGSGTSSQSVLSFYRAGTFTGNIANTNAATLYLTSSDYRLKDNTQPLTGSGAFIDALQPKTWDWKAGGRGVGFIAHEVQEVSPNSVTGAKDAVDENGNPKYQSMEYGSADFIANIIAEIQSLRARVAQLETN